MMTDSFAVKKYRHNSRKAPKTWTLADIDPADLDDEEEESLLKKAIKSPDRNSSGKKNADNTLRTMDLPFNKSWEVSKEEEEPVF